MKKLLSILITFLFSAQLSAQGDLQFDSVLVEQFQCNTSSINTIDITVPANKVLKITNISLGSQGGGSGYQYHQYAQLYYRKNPTTTAYTFICAGADVHSTAGTNGEVIWLNEGVYTFKLASYNGNTGNCSAIINGIFFNIIP